MEGKKLCKDVFNSSITTPDLAQKKPRIMEKEACSRPIESNNYNAYFTLFVLDEHERRS